MFRWTARMPLWRTWSFLESQIFIREATKSYKFISFPQKNLCQTVLLVTYILVLTTLAKTFGKFRNFLTQSQKIVWKICFFYYKSFFWKCVSGHMDCSFGNSVNFVLPKALRILVPIPIVRKCFVSFRKCFLEMFRWRRRNTYWQNQSFCAIHSFLHKFRRKR